LDGRAVQLRVARWAKKAGINQHVHPHMFRHSCATHLLESSSSIREVQEFLGHASISTTAIYCHLDFKHLAKVYMATHPRAKSVATAEPAASVPEAIAKPKERSLSALSTSHSHQRQDRSLGSIHE
jgi:Phage integrase family